MKRYNGTTPWARSEQPPAEVVATEPARAANLVADLAVPLCQSLVTGALVGGLLVFALGELVPDFSGNRFKLWIGLSLGIAALAWLLLLLDTRRLLWGIERLTGLDLDRDGTAGRPQERIVVVNAGQAHQEAEQRARHDRRSQFARFVTGVPTKGTALRAWESELGRDTYTSYRDTLIRIGWAAWNSTRDDGTPNERQGWELIADPAEILKRISG